MPGADTAGLLTSPVCQAIEPEVKLGKWSDLALMV